MNKKYLLFGVIGFALMIAVVSAVAYYSMFSATFHVNPAIVVEGNIEQNLGDFSSDGSIKGDKIEISNTADSEREIIISDDSGDDISVEYVSSLELSQKAVDFNSEKWNVIDGDKATVEYTVAGDKFNAKVISGEKEGYVLVYYKDNSDRFNNPADAIGIDFVEENIPSQDDGNYQEYDYCVTGEYDTCHGAKIWYVPQKAIVDGVIDWSKADEFLFETELIQYNSEGNIVIYPGQTLEITPVYTAGPYASGDYTIKTTIA